ncbi:hypothetical protein, partial [Olleya namhaensis]
GTETTYDETTTIIALNADDTNIDYTDENGLVTQLDLTDLVDNLETVTSLTFNTTTNQLEYIDEDGTRNPVDLSSLVHTGTQGSIFFAGADGNPTEDNNQLFWDETNNRMGIGTNTPDNKLQVSGAIRSAGFLNSDGNAGEPSYRFTDDTNTGMYSPAADEIGFTVGGVEALNIDETSGATTVTINETLDLDGPVLDENDLPGTPGQVLTATATGTVWASGDDADSDPTNEHNTAFSADGTNLTITDGGSALSVPLTDIDSEVTQVVTAGNTIATHQSASGTSTDILETVTTFVENTDGTVTYTNENNVATTVGSVGPQGATGPPGPAGVDGVSPTITLVKETIGIVFAAAHTQANGTNSFNINCSVTRTGVGRYTVAFATAHPNGVNYDIAFGVQEDAVNRDSRLASVVTGTQTANGFQVMVATGDNGVTADVLVDEVWYFNTSATKEVITDVTVSKPGPSAPGGSGTNTATPTGAITGNLVSDNFQDGNGNAPFDLQIRNNSGTTFANGYQILLDNVPYSSIPNLNLGDHTLVINDNGDGTYDYLFSYTNSVAAWASVPKITGDLPVPAGTGSSCGCVTFYSN